MGETNTARRGTTLEEKQPPYEDESRRPKTLTRTRHIDDILYVAGRSPIEGQTEYDIMFVTASVEEEEATQSANSVFGMRIAQPAEYLKGANGVIKDVALRAGLDFDKCYYTACCKWLLPRAQRAKPSKKIMSWGLPVLKDEIARVKPKIIVAMGKIVFDLLSSQKISFDDAHGCWFWSEEYNAHLYVMYSPYTLVGKPEYYETFRVDFREIARRRDLLSSGVSITGLPFKYDVIRSMTDLHDWLSKLETLVEEDMWPGHRDEHGNPLLAVDCEWHGRTHVDGKLRTIQFAWSEIDSVVIEFRDETTAWSFDLGEDVDHVDQGSDADDSYKARYLHIGKTLSRTLDSIKARYIGHHFPADSPWMHHVLGMEVYTRCELDTEFAQQTIDESSELGLERGIAMKYTNLGRYDQTLAMWKRDNKKLCEGGYGYIPSSIIIPYSCLRKESKVILGDGSAVSIGKLVNSRYNGEVKALVNGRVETRRVINWHKSDAKQKQWFKLRTLASRSGPHGVTGPAFTPDHEVLTLRGKCRVDELVPREDRIITDERRLTKDQLSLVLGSLLGDGGCEQRNDSRAGFKCGQSGVRIPYAEWKVAALTSVWSFNRREVVDTRKGNRQPSVTFSSSFSRQMVDVITRFPRADSAVNRNRKLIVSADLLRNLGPLGLAVWYQDDGTFTRDKTCRIICKKLTDTEVKIVDSFFGKFGDARYDRKQGAIVFTRDASVEFLRCVSPFMHKACGYKSDMEVGDKISELALSSSELFAELVVDVVPTASTQKGSGFRYCLTVEDAGNFLTTAGFVSNCADVITPYRAYPLIKRQLEAQRLWDYYRDIFNPFVTDVFTEFTLTGLPMDIQTMDDLRQLFTFTKNRLDVRFKQRIADEATHKLKSKLITELGLVKAKPIIQAAVNRDAESVRELVKAALLSDGKLSSVSKWNKIVAHWEESPAFNIRSPDQMARWLFDFEELTPIKSTNQKAKGLPSMAWEKVMELPPERQLLFKPAVDKQTLAILAEKLPAIDPLLDLNAVGNLSKAFLREPDVFVDEKTGEEVTEEHGLHAWLASDGKVHGQCSTTETGRPRSWAPNTLNWPSYVNERVSMSVASCVQEAYEQGDLPDYLMKWAGVSYKKLPSIRSCVKTPDDWVLVESDYATAEVVALAVISGDKDLARILFDPDPEWAILKNKQFGASVVRVSFADTKVSGVPTSARNDKFIMHVWVNGECLGPVSDEDLLRDGIGKVVNARYDIHWTLIERTYGKYRETMKAKTDRNAAKVLNFSSMYGASANSLERKIESDTGVKPEPGTGERGLEAIRERQPRATEFLEEMARVPKEKGMYRAASGRIRHSSNHAAGSGVGWRTRNSIESALGREFRNFPMQESVGSTSARACNWLLRIYKKLGLKARLMACLYDSILTLCPLEERFLVSRLHTLCMSEFNQWHYSDDLGKRTLQYAIETEFNYRWSTRPSEAVQAQLDDRAYYPASARLNFLESHPKLAEIVGLRLT